MRGITWKKRMHGWEGLTKDNKDKAQFCVEGRYCVTDLRKSNTSKTFVMPKSYRIDSVDEGKRIAEELYNNENLDKHEANHQAMEAESRRSAKVIQDAQNFLDKLKNKNNIS